MGHNMKIPAKDVLVGYRLNIIRELFTDFLSKLKGAGAELAFVFSTKQVHKTNFDERQEEAYENGHEVAAADGNLNSTAKAFEEKLHKDWKFQFPINSAVVLALSQVASEFGKTYGMSSASHEITTHTVNLAENLKAMAILSLDTYYFFCQGTWEFWSDSDLDMQAMTVRQYNRPEVLELLGLAREKQDLFVALSELLRTKSANLKNTKSKRTKAPNFEGVLTFVKELKYPCSDKELTTTVGTAFGFCPNDLIKDIAKTNQKLDRTVETFPDDKVKDVIGLIKDDVANYAEEILVNLPIYISPVYFDLR